MGLSGSESGGMMKPTYQLIYIIRKWTYLICKWRSGHSIPTMSTVDWGTGRYGYWNTDRDRVCDGDRNSSRYRIRHTHTHSHAEAHGHTHSHTHPAVDHWVVVYHRMEVRSVSIRGVDEWHYVVMGLVWVVVWTV